MWGAIAGLALGAVKAGISGAKASKLPDPKEHTVSPELRLAYNMSRRRADEWYSVGERAAFEQMLARQGTAAKRMFQNAGLAEIGSAASNIMGVDALNQFAANGAGIRRQNFSQFANLAGQVDRVEQMETSRFNNRLMAEEQALGGGIQAGIDDMFKGAQSADNFIQNENAINSYGNMFGGNQSGGDQSPFFKSNAGGGSGGQQDLYGFNPNFKASGMGAFGFQPQQASPYSNGNGQNMGYGNNNSWFGQRPNNQNLYGFNPQ